MKVCILAGLLLAFRCTFAQPQKGPIPSHQKHRSTHGYVLFAPLNSKVTYLIDKCGKEIHSWESKFVPAQSVYLLPDGSILRAGNDSLQHSIPATGGRIERFDWDNKLIWSYSILTDTERQHHDIFPMPNGNVLAIVYQRRTREEAAAAGRRPSEMEPYLLDEKIVEIKPIGVDSGIIIWQWDAWDHLVQNRYPEMPNYGVPIENPQLLNINYVPTPGVDWLHFNSISYNTTLDQIVVSSHEFSEIFILDHSTTTAEAASHKGGKRGKGGDLLYRWGNPIAYQAGTQADQKFFRQHNAHWIEKGMKDEGKIMVFNNGLGRQAGFSYSTVDVIEPSMDKKGNYIMKPGHSCLPLAPSWNYTATDTACFFSMNISSAQRLSNGNTLICAGHLGRFFEIDPDKNIVWEYNNHENNQPSSGDDKHKRNGQVFRCTLYEPSYVAFKGHNLASCKPRETDPVIFHCLPK